MDKNLFLLKHPVCQNIAFTSTYQMPKVKSYLGDIPKKLVSFNRIRKTNHYVADAAMHFYIDDKFFECVWNNPERYLDILRRCPYVIPTDYSLYAEMNLPQALWNSYRNKMLSAWMQAEGILIIPNISWSRPWSYSFCFDGYPKRSIIAINSTGIRRDPFSQDLFKKGYDAAMDALDPIKILRYGAKQRGEREDISIYYDNDNKNAITYGSEWFLQ